jgi:hypothetical protein
LTDFRIRIISGLDFHRKSSRGADRSKCAIDLAAPGKTDVIAVA